ncbi:MAG: GAF domain-containing protein [Deltaproteobacteria bacterium]|nr:GAF domain-containing protein [Deltaproteobacteria bacterium]
MERTLSAWPRYLEGFPRESGIRRAILTSRDKSGVESSRDGASAAAPRRVDSLELATRKAQSAALLDVATPHLEWISAYLGQKPHVVYLVDFEGIILWSTGMREMLESAPLAPGYDWSEAVMGTNGAGTALASGNAIAIVGDEHFDRWGGCACTAAPIRGPNGQILGAIDVSTGTDDATPERLAIVSHVAWAIERELVTMILRDRLHSHERLRRVVQAAVQNLPNAILIASSDRTFVCASRGAEALLDERGIGLDLRAISIRPPDGPNVTLDEIVERSRKGEHVELCGECICGDMPSALSVRASPLWDGAQIVGVIIAFDRAFDGPFDGPFDEGSGPADEEAGPCSCRRSGARSTRIA